MLDEILDCKPHESVTAAKNVSASEPHFAGHFPGNPVMPGVLIVEAMAQAGGVLSHISNGDLEPKPLYFLARVEEARFRRPVVPGERIELRVVADKIKRGMWWYRCSARVDDELVAEALIVCAPGGGAP
jgi:3-hydroxyacyl-[acyl-carrier-protein] dehydratase